MNQYRSFILLTVCIGLVYGMACFLMQSEPLQETVQILPAPATESVQKSNLPIVRPSAFKAALPQVATSVVASSVPSVVAPSVTTTSSLATRSVAGGLTHYAAPIVPNVANEQHVTAYTYMATPQHSSSPVSVITHSSALPQRAPQHRAPGTIGSTWEDWLNRYYDKTGAAEGDLSGLQDWWNAEFGGGFTPDGAYGDFYDWAKTQYTSLADANWLLLVLLLLYGVALYERVRTNKFKDE